MPWRLMQEVIAGLYHTTYLCHAYDTGLRWIFQVRLTSFVLYMPTMLGSYT